MYIIYLVCCVVMVYGEAVLKDSQKDEYCTDPRTMRKHAAYTEWADAYSCTRHRCQPGGRNLAIYTVGCKRVEAPESAIECEEVVEDTNMQFPYCCTRLRCLVVVRGEVWTRVLGQPWETLPAAPWSHMYKMKKPPPVDGSFLPKSGPVAGPVYELSEDKPVDRRAIANDKDCDKPVKRASASPGPDIVIALTTNNEKKPTEAEIQSKFLSRADDSDQPNEIEAEEAHIITEKVPEIISEERMFSPEKKTSRDRKYPETSDDEMNYKGIKESRPHKTSLFAPGASSDEQYTNMNKRGKKQKVDAVSEERFFTNPEKKAPRSWARIPQEQWNASPNTRAQAQPDARDYEKEHENQVKAEQPSNGESEEKQEDKPASLQHLVNAIGTRMRDIENVVQQMSEKVQPPIESVERMRGERAKKEAEPKAKQANSDNYNRFPPQEGSSKYLRAVADTTTEVPLFVGDNLNGYFSDPSNNLLRRSMNNKGPKEPHETYMVPIDTDHADHKKPSPDSAEPDFKHKKRSHKKKKSKHGRRKHRREEKKFSRIPEGNAVSIEDSNDFGKA
ncbi:uncharacterized protein LOC133532111 isoform X2 [Cydia pomonella]|uniref:uncharacterized protein LOC133532111 isoform X2 n=1 Tax=Cydia pomonella TaxID=82600 RepID=UPI002ADDE0BA|nr:uncharacterized protein LOC133532111 isoform X2 [Cydia pomonella]